MSDTNRVRLSYVKESTFGSMPAGTLQDVRYTGNNFAQNSQFVRSAEIRSDRQIVDVIRTQASAGGELPFELSLGAAAGAAPYGFPDDFMYSALCSSGWSTAITQAVVNTTFTAGSNQYTCTRAAGSFSADGYLVGQWVKISGAADAGNNGYAKIVSVAALTMVVKGNGNGVTQAVAATVTFKQGSQIVNGVTLNSFSFEAAYADLSNEFVQWKGMAIDQMGLTIQASQIIQATSNWLGKTESSATATGGIGYATAPTNSVLNAVDHVASVLQGYVSLGLIQAVLNISNNLRQRMQIASLGPISLGMGSFNLTGTAQLYFANKTIMDLYRAGTATSLALVTQDGAGNAMIFDMPQVRITNAKQLTPAQNQDVIADLAFEAYMHATEQVMLRIVRFP